eukprot:TRINITY_DN2341_c0_g1_i4.p2 TRINITY_DN2341_c0_g1~~TRINITY_DN2341_c0_g1_i4.p2  ORF type:complete len:153 (+),score=21.48 TRINITY_DN2341_c0_g1_i4:43-459(+)
MGQSNNTMNVYAISDIHTDEYDNAKIVKMLSTKHFGANDVLIVAGDISANLEILRETLEHLTSCCKNVFFITGNNEMRIRKNEKDIFSDSIQKWQKIKHICDELNVNIRPKEINKILFVPLFCESLFIFYPFLYKFLL